MMINNKLLALRDLMKKNKIDAYVIPGTDEHQNEYLPECRKRREWISGFNGSAGSVAVTMNKAGLWTDFRYFLQAENQLEGTDIALFKMGIEETPDLWTWLRWELKEGQGVGIDPRLITLEKISNVKQILEPAGIKLNFMDINLIDELWQDRPPLPSGIVFPHPPEYSGESTESKIKRLRDEMAKVRCKAHILTQTDSIAWLFNVRGEDIPYNPVPIAYGIVTETTAKLYIYNSRIAPGTRKALGQTTGFHEYGDFNKHVSALKEEGCRVWLDRRTTSAWVGSMLNRNQLYFNDSPVIHFKALKNDTEIANFKKAHIRDGIAMVKFLKWLEENVPAGGVTEASAADRLEEFRRENDLYKGPSFAAISAYREHGAIVHYSHTEESSVPLEASGLYLVDSGGQYQDGTTDITRTLTLGNPSEVEKEHFTLVLMGHIDLSMTLFPEGTQGVQLDTIARKPLWDKGLDYGHGTGHGIGSYLNVHEGPHSLSPSRGTGVKLKPGMFFSIEPGYYKNGSYGIRIENIVYVAADENETSSSENRFFKLETVTLCPIDLKLIEKSLLSSKQREYLNHYHQIVCKTLFPLLSGDEKNWLKEATMPI